MSVKLTVSQLEDLVIEGVSEDEKLTVVHEDKWISDHKYEHKAIVFTDGERHYRGTVMRSGSYYSDYTWESEWNDGDADIEEVAKVTKTIEVWEAV